MDGAGDIDGPGDPEGPGSGVEPGEADIPGVVDGLDGVEVDDPGEPVDELGGDPGPVELGGSVDPDTDGVPGGPEEGGNAPTSAPADAAEGPTGPTVEEPTTTAMRAQIRMDARPLAPTRRMAKG